ncbi:MAG TPA: VOC family protein, partial [Candidatus Binataceae bacterium]|nr:VOC family protein [Candidatus Binataceae bacterium]
IADPFGHMWVVATRKEDVPTDELNRRAAQFVKQRESAQVSPIPRGMHSVTPYLQVAGAAKLIDFMKRAFGAEELMRVKMPDGTIGHAQMKVSGSIIELADANEQFKPMPTAIWLYVDDADATYQRAVAAGATSLHEPMDQDYGNREGSVRDPFGNHWYIATRLPGREPWREELRTVTPYLHPKGSSKLIEFMKRAFDAEELERHEGGGLVHHAQVKIGDSVIAMGDAHGPYQPMPPALHLYVTDADRVYRRALRAGAKSMFEPHDASYGDRMSGVTDPFGNVWYIATHQRDVPVEEMQRSAAAQEPAGTAPPAQHPERDVMPFLHIRGAEQAAEFYKQIFGATELTRDVDEHTGAAHHVQLKIGDARIMISDPGVSHAPEWIKKGWLRTAHELGGSPVHLYQYVDDADAVFQRAVAAGVTITDPIADKPWGDRCGGFEDPFGQIWSVATPLKESK